MSLNGTQETLQSIPTCSRIGYELSEYWRWVREGLLRIKKKDKETGAWTPEQVRHWLVAATNQNLAFPCLHIVHIDNKPAAFAIFTAPPDPYVLVPTTMYAFAVYADPRRVKGDMKQKVRNLLLAHAMKLGRDNGILELEGHTIREGWSRYSNDYGFRLARVVYRRSLVEE